MDGIARGVYTWAGCESVTWNADHSSAGVGVIHRLFGSIDVLMFYSPHVSGRWQFQPSENVSQKPKPGDGGGTSKNPPQKAHFFTCLKQMFCK